MYTDAVQLERFSSDHAHMVLANSAHRNALGIPELRALAQATDTLCRNPPKVLSIVAEGATFSVGGDLRSIDQALNDDCIASWLSEAISAFNQAIMQLHSMDTAIVVGVQGAAAGGALGLAWAADHVVVADDLQLNLAYARIGGSPDGGTSWILPRLVNHLRAFELFTLSPTLDAQQALRWGLANRAVPAVQLTEAVEHVARQWLDVPTVTLRNLKRLMRESQTQSIASHLEQELHGFLSAATQPEFASRVHAFIARR
jgi:2-(1,2-epoxy-1,2-dihydrophenyl)acetyl-CoA isomerase